MCNRLVCGRTTTHHANHRRTVPSSSKVLLVTWIESSLFAIATVSYTEPIIVDINVRLPLCKRGMVDVLLCITSETTSSYRRYIRANANVLLFLALEFGRRWRRTRGCDWSVWQWARREHKWYKSDAFTDLRTVSVNLYFVGQRPWYKIEWFYQGNLALHGRLASCLRARIELSFYGMSGHCEVRWFFYTKLQLRPSTTDVVDVEGDWSWHSLQLLVLLMVLWRYLHGGRSWSWRWRIFAGRIHWCWSIHLNNTRVGSSSSTFLSGHTCLFSITGGIGTSNTNL